MKYRADELIDIKQFQNLMEEFYKMSNIPFGLLDIEGNVLTGIGWQDICTKFHRVNDKTLLRCIESNKSTKYMKYEEKGYSIHICKNGLVDACAPIIIEGEHIANLFLGQLFFDKPDMEYFKEQALQYGFDIDLYLEAVSKVPIISKAKVESTMEYYSQLSKMLSSMGLNQLKQKRAEELLKKNNKNLNNIVYKRNLKIIEINEKLEQEEKELRERIELDKLKTQFFGNLSHELRTPLNLIFSSIQILDLELKNNLMSKENLNNRIEVLRQNSYRILRLANNLIDITKIDSGYFKLDLQNHNIVELVEDITISVAKYVENKSIEVLFDTEIEEKIIAIDFDSIQRIILNLLSNAIKFRGSSTFIFVNVYDEPENVVISIKDMGIGIENDKLEVIFDRFRQIDKSFTRKHEGSGIGLSLVKSLIEMHGGNIEVKSTCGIGSEFIIKLPIKEIDEEDNIVRKISSDFKNNHKELISIEFSDIYW